MIHTPITDAFLAAGPSWEGISEHARSLERKVYALKTELSLASGSRSGMSHSSMKDALLIVPPANNAVDALVRAIEIEHRHVEAIAALNKGYTTTEASMRAYGRMERFAGILANICLPMLTVTAPKDNQS